MLNFTDSIVFLSIYKKFFILGIDFYKTICYNKK